MPAVARSDWAKVAERYHGGLSLWINQTDDPMLKATNSRGVCHALTRDWLKAQTGKVIERRRFVDQFRLVHPNGTVLRYFVPNEYLAKQARYSEQYNTRSKRLIDLEQRYQDYCDRHPNDISDDFTEALEETFRLHIKLLHGKRCIAYQRALEGLHLPAIERLQQMLTKSAHRPSFHMMVMARTGQSSDSSQVIGGHAVGFEVNGFRRDGSHYCQYFDANFGLFYFTRGGGKDALTNMLTFFYDDVAESKANYATNYNKIELWEFGMGDAGTAEQARAAAVAELKP